MITKCSEGHIQMDDVAKLVVILASHCLVCGFG